jgi:hypothetical protein
MSESKPVYLFYYIQNERGEDAQHPNACKVNCSVPGKILFQDILSSFPLDSSSSFHFRFQTTIDKQTVFLDITNPEDTVPVVGVNIVAKVLRLDNLTCATKRTDGLTLRQNFMNTHASTHESSPKDVAPRAQSTAQSTNVASSSNRVQKVSNSNASSSSSSVPSSSFQSADSKQVKSVAHINTSDVVVPDEVDEDLQGKSDYVKAQVMARRNELKKAQQERLAEAARLEAEKLSDAQEKDAAKAIWGPKLSEWSDEPSGSKKNIRILLSTLHTILWEGAKWEPVPMAKLIVALKVKIYFMKAITIVHPDKHNHLNATQQYIATTIFHTLESAYRPFQETELS